MPTARKMTRMGTPRRFDSELIRMLAATNKAPMKNRWLMLPTSK